MNSPLELFLMLILLAAYFAWDIFGIPQSLVTAFDRMTRNVQPSIGCIAVAGWLLFAGGIALVLRPD